ncbi:MAG: 16S rRNA (adenine(1518)-N(6)/adenine(1519)-N(6))-dimethyltransferase RsmA [Candidatus Omnitrophica bacterium]|nr:16S rRNA (adenine(1518)-N(6)/adenine(1519)-N(6))-dimethyltransferase RsmA [Candidatus Omnitrophota bacterium]
MRIRPKKRLGQNFLKDTPVRRRIINACGLSRDDYVLEIGAGRGEMTGLIGPLVKRLWAVELDRDICPLLRKNTAGLPQVDILNEDILKIDITRRFAGVKPKLKIIGNLPYYISTPILEHLILHRGRLQAVYIMLQKEFARRMTAQAGSGDFGSLSCFIQYYARPELLFGIPKGAFYPQPKVDSAFVKLTPHVRTAFQTGSSHEKMLFRLIRAAFNQRRKTLRNSLKTVLDADTLKRLFQASGTGGGMRPQAIGLEGFIKLTRVRQQAQ